MNIVRPQPTATHYESILSHSTDIGTAKQLSSSLSLLNIIYGGQSGVQKARMKKKKTQNEKKK
jgi:hypothetical protein